MRCLTAFSRMACRPECLHCAQRVIFAAVLPVLAAFSSLPAFGAGNNLLDEVIVTARKVEQSLQDVPSFVSGLSGSLIAESGANNIVDLKGTAPNVVLQDMLRGTRSPGGYAGIRFTNVRAVRTACRRTHRFWRDATGHEIDVLIDTGERVIPVETKSV